MNKYDAPMNYFDMDLKGVFKLNKTAHLRLGLYINTLEKRQEQSRIKLDHDIRETKRKIASIEDEKNKLVMKLLRSYVRKTRQKKKTTTTRIPDSVVHSRSGVNTGVTFSTYVYVPGGSATISDFHPPVSHYKQPHSIPVRPSDNESRRGSVHGAKAYSDFVFPLQKHLSRDSKRQDTYSRSSKLTDAQRFEVNSRISSRQDIHSRFSTRRESHSRVSKVSWVSELPATRGQIIGNANSDYFHNHKVKEMLGGNPCLFRGYHPGKGYEIEPLHKKVRGILPSELHPDDYIKPHKLLERIRIFGNVKLPNMKHGKCRFDKLEEYTISPLQRWRLQPTLPPILPNFKRKERVGNSVVNKLKHENVLK